MSGRLWAAVHAGAATSIGAALAVEFGQGWVTLVAGVFFGIIATWIYDDRPKAKDPEAWEIVDRVHGRRLHDDLFASPADAQREMLRQGGSGIATVRLVRIVRVPT